MSKYSYKNFLLGQEIVKSQQKFSHKITRSSTVDTTRLQQMEHNKHKKSVCILLTKICQRIRDKTLKKALNSMIYNNRINHSLGLLSLFPQRLLKQGFFNILASSNNVQSFKKIQKSKQFPSPKILLYLLNKIIKKQINYVFTKLIRVSKFLQTQKQSIQTISQMQKSIQKNIKSYVFYKFKYCQFQNKNLSNSASKLCLKLIRIYRNSLQKSFQNLIYSIYQISTTQCLQQKTKIYSKNNILASSRVNRVNNAKLELQRVKNDLEYESSIKHKRKKDIIRAIASQKSIFREDKKKTLIMIQKMQIESQKSQDYYSALKSILQKRRKLKNKSKGMKNKVQNIYSNISQDTNFSIKGYLTQRLAIINEDQYHLYINQKYRMLIMLYERDNPVFDKWPEQEKIIKQNNGLKSLIKSIIQRSYQSIWVDKFLQNLQN